MPRKRSELPLIGRSDHLDLPDLGIYDISSRIDTGAASSSIHCEKIRVKEDASGKEYLSVKFEKDSRKWTRIAEFTERRVRSSNGMSEYRFVIFTSLLICGHQYQTEITLADRESMRFPLLIGRKALHGKFIVDVRKTNVSHRQKLKATR